MYSSMEYISSSQKFPYKLWTIVNGCSTGAIKWGKNGNTILLEYSLFQQQYLDHTAFKTSNLTSFIRQLNLYGFHKVSSPRKACSESGSNTDHLHEFQNENFKRGRPELLPQVLRKPSSSASATKMKASKGPSSPVMKRQKRQDEDFNSFPLMDVNARHNYLQQALQSSTLKWEKSPKKEDVHVESDKDDSDVLTELVTDHFQTVDWADTFSWDEDKPSASNLIIDTENVAQFPDESSEILELTSQSEWRDIKAEKGSGDHHENQKAHPIMAGKQDFANLETCRNRQGTDESENLSVIVQTIGFPSGQWTSSERDSWLHLALD